MPQMPQKFPWSKSNRSHNSVETSSSGQPSPVPSGKRASDRPIVRASDEQALAVNNDVAAQRYQPVGGQQAPLPTQQPPVQQQQQQQQQLPPGVSQEQFAQHFPQRSTSQVHRLSAHLDQVSQNYQQQPGPPLPSPGLEHNRRSYQPQPSPVVYVQQEPKKQSLRSRIAAGLTGHKDDESSKQAQKNGVGRRQSVRKTDPRLQDYQSPEGNRLHASQQQWHQRQGSSPHVPTSDEQDEDNLDPFLQQDGHDTPQVPPKDPPYQQLPQQQQQFVPNPRQEQYTRPPLGRVSTEGSYQTQGGVDHYSPDQHQGQGLQQPQQQTNQQQQQQQYQSYQPTVQHPQNPNEYQAFNPQNVPSPLLGNAQLHGQGQELTQQQQNYYQYQQQQQAPQQAQGQSPQDNSPQNIHYQQQQHFAPQSQPHKGQDLQQQQPQTIRPPSQQQAELQHPQATRQPPQIVQQGQQIDTQQLQQLRPPSSQQHQQLAPPSPLQPPSYQTYDAQQGKQPQPSDPHTHNTTTPQQGQDKMAPSAQGSVRNTLRKVNDGGQQQPGAPSRESSLLQQAPAQGQPLGPLPVSPGIASFDANVVPTASQGQPYRGEKGQGPQGGEMGRATPPPRSSVNDMTDEEIEKMMKEHEVLRELHAVHDAWTTTDQPQARSIRRSSDTSSSSKRRYTNCKIPWQTSASLFLGQLGTTANTLHASTD